MSVIVKGMEMPTKCCECDAENYDESFYGDEFNHVCSFIYKGYTEKIRDSGRRDDCPLRPLPQKHGRLIDADRLIDAAMRSYSPLLAGDILKRLIDFEPTVVEAEDD